MACLIRMVSSVHVRGPSPAQRKEGNRPSPLAKGRRKEGNRPSPSPLWCVLIGCTEKWTVAKEGKPTSSTASYCTSGRRTLNGCAGNSKTEASATLRRVGKLTFSLLVAVREEFALLKCSKITSMIQTVTIVVKILL